MSDPDYSAGRSGWLFPPNGDWTQFRQGQASREQSGAGGGLILIGAAVVGLAVAVWLTPIWLPAVITGLVSAHLLRRSGAPARWWSLAIRYSVFSLIVLTLGIGLLMFVNDQRALFFWDEWRIAEHARLAQGGALLPIDDEPGRLGRVLAIDWVAWVLVAGLPGAMMIAACMFFSPKANGMAMKMRISHRLVVAVLLTGLLGLSVLAAAFAAHRFWNIDEVGLEQPDPILIRHVGSDRS